MHVTELETASMAGASPDQGANEMLGALGKRFVRIVGAIDDIASDVRGYVARPALGGVGFAAPASAGAQREAARSRRITHHHRHGRLALNSSSRRAEFGLDDQSVTVLGQCIADLGELGLLAFALTIQASIGVGDRSMRAVATRLGVEVTFAVAATRRRLVRAILGAEAFHRGPRRDLRTVNRDVCPIEGRAPPCGLTAQRGTCARPRPAAAVPGSSRTPSAPTGSSASSSDKPTVQ
jgi:hypothetical protein